VLATGGTAEATLGLVEQAGGIVAGLCVLLELGFLNGRSRLAGREVQALLTV
jgi:adenine phosphoribosyltransferase